MEQGGTLQIPLLLLRDLGVRLTHGCLWKESPGRGPSSWNPPWGCFPLISCQGGESPFRAGSLPFTLVSPPALPSILSSSMNLPFSAFPFSWSLPPESSSSRLVLFLCLALLAWCLGFLSLFTNSGPPLSICLWSPHLSAPHRYSSGEAFRILQSQDSLGTCPQEPFYVWRTLSSDSSFAPPPALLTFN